MATGVLIQSLGNGAIWDQLGNALSNHQVYVYARGTSNQVQVYSDSGLTIPLSQPLLTGANGAGPGGIPGYVAGGQDLDLYDATTGVRQSAEPLIAGATAVGTSTPYTTIEAHGHSYPYGDYATGGRGYVTKLGAILGQTPTNRAAEGANVIFDQQATGSGGAIGNGWCKVLQDLPRSAGAAPYLPASSLYVVQYGINDLGNVGPGPVPMSRIKMATRTIISRIRAAGTGVFEESHASVTPSAAQWSTATQSTSNSGAAFIYSTVNGSTITIAVPSDFPGGTIALGYQAQQGTSATYTVTVDGNAAGSVSTLNMAAAVTGRTNNGMCGIHRLTGLAPGAHTIVATTSAIVTAAAFDYWQIEAPNPPLVLLVGQPRLIAGGYLAYSDAGNNFTVNDASVQQLNVALAQVAAEFDSQVQFVELDALMGANASYFGTGSHLINLHPNDAGHSRIAAACLRTVQAQGAWLPLLASAA